MIKTDEISKILKSQLADLDDEALRIEDEFASQFGLPTFEKHKPSGLMPMLHADIAYCESSIRQLKLQLEACGHLPSLKGWLKQVSIRRQGRRDLDFPF